MNAYRSGPGETNEAMSQRRDIYTLIGDQLQDRVPSTESKVQNTIRGMC